MEILGRESTLARLRALRATPERATGRWARGPRALLLDVDDTLVDTRAAMVAAGGAAAASLWPHEPPELHHRAGVHFHRDPGGWFRRYTAGEMAFEAMRAARVADLVTVLGLAPVDDAHRRFERAYQRGLPRRLRLFGDATPCWRPPGGPRCRWGC